MLSLLIPKEAPKFRSCAISYGALGACSLGSTLKQPTFFGFLIMISLYKFSKLKSRFFRDKVRPRGSCTLKKGSFLRFLEGFRKGLGYKGPCRQIIYTVALE